MRTLECAYAREGIETAGNDIDPKWASHYPKGVWLIGDALQIPLRGFDTAVFAPPLSKGFSGRREDSLLIPQVRPSYDDFLDRQDLPPTCVLVLPGRSLSTKGDRVVFFELISRLSRRFVVDYDELKDERRRVTKYVDLYLRRPE